MALGLLVAAPAFAQYVEVPTFGAGGAAPGFSVLSSTVAPGDDGDFMTVWEEYSATDHKSPVLHGIVNRHVTLPDTFGPASRWESSINRSEKPAIGAVPGGFFDVWSQIERTRWVLLGLRLNRGGAPVGNEFEVADADDIDWLGPEAAVVPFRSGVVFFWWERLAAIQHVAARLFDLDGTPRGPSFEVGNSPSYPYVDAVEVADGGFVFGWGGVPQATGNAIGRSYQPNGEPRGDAFMFSEETGFRRLAVSADGTTIAMVGTRAPGSSTPHEIWAGRYAIDGTPLGSEFLVYAAAPDVALAPDVEFDLAGNLYVTWTEYFVGTRARGFDAQNVPLGPAVDIGTQLSSEVRTARLTDGRFVNVLSEYDSDTIQATIVSLCRPGVSVCGDGVLRSECEVCDDGAGNSDTTPDACRTTCRPAGCGDGVIDSGEACDDGNRVNCDGCSEFCAVEVGLGCGDGIPNQACGEPCDDGNAMLGDGCAPACTLERVPGGGSIVTDCYTEWVVDNVANDPLLDRGEFRRLQLCTDGDARCDFDPTPGVCGFRVRVCANNTEVAGCTAGSRLASWELRSPSASSAAKHPVVAAARAALLAAVPSAIVGPATRDVCSAFVDVPVALRASAAGSHAGKLSLKTTASQYDGSRDTDTLKLVCVPPVP